MLKIMENKKRFVTYCIFGSVAAIVELFSFWMLVNSAGIAYWIGAPISFILATLLNFFLQKRFTFKNSYKRQHKQAAVFLIIAIGGFLINWGATIAYTEFLNLLPLYAKAGAILTALVYNYTMNKRITFGKMQ